MAMPGQSKKRRREGDDHSNGGDRKAPKQAFNVDSPEIYRAAAEEILNAIADYLDTEVSMRPIIAKMNSERLRGLHSGMMKDQLALSSRRSTNNWLRMANGLLHKDMSVDMVDRMSCRKSADILSKPAPPSSRKYYNLDSNSILPIMRDYLSIATSRKSSGDKFSPDPFAAKAFQYFALGSIPGDPGRATWTTNDDSWHGFTTSSSTGSVHSNASLAASTSPAMPATTSHSHTGIAPVESCTCSGEVVSAAIRFDLAYPSAVSGKKLGRCFHAEAKLTASGHSGIFTLGPTRTYWDRPVENCIFCALFLNSRGERIAPHYRYVKSWRVPNGAENLFPKSVLNVIYRHEQLIVEWENPVNQRDDNQDLSWIQQVVDFLCCFGRKDKSKTWLGFDSDVKVARPATHPIVGDGNCLFRSIAYVIEGNEADHQQYREATINFMQANPAMFNFLPEGELLTPEYYTRMRVPAADASDRAHWGGRLEVQGLAELFGLIICVFNPLGGGEPEVFRPSIGGDYPVVNLWFNGGHYEVIV